MHRTMPQRIHHSSFSTACYGLIGTILLVGAPHADHLPLWVSALCLMLLGWRLYLAWSGNPLPPRWLLLGLTVASVCGIALSFRTLFGREVGVTLLILLASLKLLELKSTRDAMVLIYLACFIIITNFFYSQSITTAAFMLLSLLVIFATWLHLQNPGLPLRPRLRLASMLLLQAIPLMLLLFMFFPRVQGPLWGLPQDAYAASGLSDSMSPGSISQLTLSDAVAFRVSFAGRPPPQRYWRGPVLWDYDGSTWSRGRPATRQPPQLSDLAEPLDYSVTLEPHNKPWLFALELPTQLSIPAWFTSDFQLLNPAPVNTRLRYDVRSHLSYRANPEETAAQLRRALALPAGYNPRARALAARWQAQYRSPEAILRAALDYYHQNGFRYTLEPPLLGRDAMDDFLFTTRRGFCEHYASSFVFLMRAAGIPARVVTGYLGGSFNELGGYYIVRQSDAHAWAEVWLEQRGWLRVDPTSAIAPDRIENGLAAALPDNAALPFLLRTQSPLLHRLRMNLDALTNQWNQWVLGYDTERQFAFLTRLGMENITWQRLAIHLLTGLGLVLSLLAWLALRQLYPKQHDAAQKIWLALCRKLALQGWPRAAHEGPQDYVARLAAAHPAHAATLHDLARRYIALRYAAHANLQSLRAFRRAVATFNTDYPLDRANH